MLQSKVQREWRSNSQLPLTPIWGVRGSYRKVKKHCSFSLQSLIGSVIQSPKLTGVGTHHFIMSQQYRTGKYLRMFCGGKNAIFWQLTYSVIYTGTKQVMVRRFNMFTNGCSGLTGDRATGKCSHHTWSSVCLLYLFFKQHSYTSVFQLCFNVTERAVLVQCVCLRLSLFPSFY